MARVITPLLAAALVAWLLVAPSAEASRQACRDAHAQPRAGNLRQIEHSIRCLLDEQRRAHGLRGLRANPGLRTAAAEHSRDMVAHHYFAHSAPDGRDYGDRIRRLGYISGGGFWMLGENLGWGAGAAATPAAIVQAWMNSPPHRHNILTGTFRDLGVAVAIGSPRYRRGPRAATYTTDFGYRSR